jgi:signal transduction histidine kinase/CheY-like chemotaxis protein
VRWLPLVFLVSLACRAAAPGEPRVLGGQLPYEHFTQGTMGIALQAQGSLVDPRGRLLIKGEQLAVFDGAKWSNYPVPGGTVLRSLAFGTGNRLWAGAINQLGYFEMRGEEFEFHSLLSFLPPDRRDIQDVWTCAEIYDRVFFVCTDRVLAWDGSHFQEWNFATARRLFPLRVRDELWFTHHETGLYRVTAQGPQKQYAPSQLPAKPAFWAERQGDRTIIAASVGVFPLGETTPLGDSALTAFLTQNLLIGGLRLPTGEVAFATFGGVAITSPDLQHLRRVLSVREGLPSNSIVGLDIDEAGYLWITTMEGGVVRTDSRDGGAIYAAGGPALHPFAVESVAATDSAIFALTQEGVASLSLGDGARDLKTLPAGTGRFRRVVPMGDGLALLGLNEIRLLRDGRQQRIVERPSTTFFDLAASPQRPHRWFGLANFQLFQIESDDGERYDYTPLQSLKLPADSIVVDWRERVWINSPFPLVTRYDPAAKKLEEFKLPVAMETARGRGTQMVLDGDDLCVFYGREGFRSPTAEYQPRALPLLPEGASLVRVVLDPRTRTIHALVERANATGARAFGLCSLSLAADVPAWRDWYLPQLDELGSPRSIAVDPVDGQLWFAGERGLLRLDPAAFAMRPTLRRPSLAVRGIEDPTAVPYEGHSLIFTVHSPDWGRRHEIGFQTRLRTRDQWSEWSAPVATSRFTFQNLADGEHEFSVRAIDTAGQVSDEAHYTFRVLPPFWRSPWAVAGYLLTGVGIGWASVRLRERSIRRRNEELERTVAERTAELRKANAAKDDFLSSMSHEIRNPLNGVVGLAAAINVGTLEPQTRLKFEYLQHCATHLAALLEDILDFSQLEADAVTFNPQPFDLPKAMQAIAAITASQSTKSGRRLDIQIAPNVPRFLIGDAARIRQTVINLVINALKYGERGDVQLTVWTRQTTPEKCTVTFAVSDAGPGIAPEELARLFTRFTRGEAARRSRASGSGIGLAISKALAEKMGGRLWAESQLGEGSTFYLEISLPLALSAAEQSAAIEPLPAWSALLVDDEDYNRLALESLLESAGFKLTSVSHGEAALAAAAQETFDIIFLDYDLPGMTGPELARALRMRPDLPPDVVIIGVTAFVNPQKHEECRRAGMNAVITKPVTSDKLRGALAGATRWNRAAPSVELLSPTSADPLASLRLAAERKHSSLADELVQFDAAMAEDLFDLEQAITRREPAAAGHAVHRLVGRLAYVRATSEESLARELEAALQREEWERAGPLWSSVTAQVDALRARLRHQP